MFCSRQRCWMTALDDDDDKEETNCRRNVLALRFSDHGKLATCCVQLLSVVLLLWATTSAGARPYEQMPVTVNFACRTCVTGLL